jgi:peptidoglycan/xylan/chitin deacetylase (PgdA/CDA1 family)
MTLVGTGTLRRIFHKLRNRIAPPALILLYHRVAEVDSDPWSLSVTPQNLTEHLEVIRKRAIPVPLKQLTKALQNGKRVPRSIVITFDDGYANNFHIVKPLLERYDIPATVFVTSGYMGKSEEFWWDELDQILLQPRRLPEELHLHIKGSIHSWTLGAAVEYSEEDYRRDAGRPAQEAETGSRLFLYYSVWQQLQTLPNEQRREALAEIMAWANVKPVARPTHRPLTSEEVCMLEQGGLIEVGAHTVTHPLLATYSLSFQRDEIRTGKRDLEDLLGHPVTSFSYPHGSYTAETVGLVREAGFNCACSTITDSIGWRNTDLLQLPRFSVGNWGGEEFDRRLSTWLRC